MSLEADSLISVPMGIDSETQKNKKYRWENDRRTIQSYVIFQWSWSGEGRYDSGGKSWALPAGTAFVSVLPEKSVYYYPPESREPWSFGWINFQGKLALDLWGKLQSHRGPVFDLPLGTGLQEEFRHLIWNTRERQWSSRWEESEACYRFYLGVVRVFERAESSEGGISARAKEYLIQRFRSPIAIKEVAAQFGMSREHLTREFTLQFQESPGAFLRRLRLEEASRLLRQTAIPIQEVAIRSGFSNST